MTVAALITCVLDAIRKGFYLERPARDFLRDERALTRAIARYGHECERRGWEFQAAFIEGELLLLLAQIQKTGADVKYFPVYLEGAVDRSIRLRSEELSDRARSIVPRVSKIVGGCKSVVVVEKTDVEVLSALYKDLKRNSPRRRRGAEKTKQEVLL